MLAMAQQMPQSCARTDLFFAVLLLLHEQIITLSHLQQAVQSPLAGLMATLVGES